MYDPHPNLAGIAMVFDITNMQLDAVVGGDILFENRL